MGQALQRRGGRGERGSRIVRGREKRRTGRRNCNSRGGKGRGKLARRSRGRTGRARREVGRRHQASRKKQGGKSQVASQTVCLSSQY